MMVALDDVIITNGQAHAKSIIRKAILCMGFK
jgi:hypothetical protein